MSYRSGLSGSRLFLASRWWVFAIYSIAFAGPLLSRLTKEAATALGCAPWLSLTLAYGVIFLLVVVGVPWLATRWRELTVIRPMSKPFGLPVVSVDPIVAVLAAIAILLVPPLIGRFGQDSPVFAASVDSAYRVAYRVGAIVVTPLIEEVGHRWLLYRGLRPERANFETPRRRLVCVAPAIAMSGVFFGLVHYLVAGPVRIAVTMVVGMILALSYEITGRLWVPVLAHGLINMHGNLTAQFDTYGGYALIVVTSLIMVFCWVTLVRKGDELRPLWN